MDLIEQLGGYEKSKEVLINSSSYTHIDIYDGVKYFLYEKQAENMSVNNVVTFNPRTKEISSAHVSGGLYKYGGWHVSILDIEKALLQYRRQHNIFEVGDKVVFTDILNSCVVTFESTETDPMQIFWLTYPDGTAGYVFHLNKIKHATDEEIKAGHRL